MKRYSVLPLTLYRLQATTIPVFRLSTSFDFIVGQNQLYNPTLGEVYKVPNGLSMRPIGFSLVEILDTFDAKFIYELPAGLVIPQNFIVIHEHNDHYSFQTTCPIKPKQFEKLAGQFFANQKLLTQNQLVSKINRQLRE